MDRYVSACLPICTACALVHGGQVDCVGGGQVWQKKWNQFLSHGIFAIAVDEPCDFGDKMGVYVRACLLTCTAYALGCSG